MYLCVYVCIYVSMYVCDNVYMCVVCVCVCVCVCEKVMIHGSNAVVTSRLLIAARDYSIHVL